MIAGASEWYHFQNQKVLWSLPCLWQNEGLSFGAQNQVPRQGETTTAGSQSCLWATARPTLRSSRQAQEYELMSGIFQNKILSGAWWGVFQVDSDTTK